MPHRPLAPMVLLLALVPCFGTSRAAPAGSIDLDLREELRRLEASLDRLEGVELPEMVRELVARQRAALDTVRRADTPVLAFYRLRAPFVSLTALELVAAHREVEADLAGFDALWNQHGAPYGAAARSLVNASPVARVLHQVASNRAEKLYRAARPYAKASSPLAGLYYLGEAEGERKFAALVTEIAGSWPPSSERPPSAEAVGAAIEALERETVAAFAGDPASPALIPVSARLKEARELLERGSLEGAAWMMLESRLVLSRRLATGRADGPDHSASKETAAQGTSVAPPTDGSLLALVLALGAEGGAPDGTAALVHSDVLPLYESVLGSRP